MVFMLLVGPIFTYGVSDEGEHSLVGILIEGDHSLLPLGSDRDKYFFFTDDHDITFIFKPNGKNMNWWMLTVPRNKVKFNIDTTDGQPSVAFRWIRNNRCRNSEEILNSLVYCVITCGREYINIDN